MIAENNLALILDVVNMLEHAQRIGPTVDQVPEAPELVAGRIQTAMIIAAALIEGVTFFALIICFLQNPFGG